MAMAMEGSQVVAANAAAAVVAVAAAVAAEARQAVAARARVTMVVGVPEAEPAAAGLGTNGRHCSSGGSNTGR